MRVPVSFTLLHMELCMYTNSTYEGRVSLHVHSMHTALYTGKSLHVHSIHTQGR